MKKLYLNLALTLSLLAVPAMANSTAVTDSHCTNRGECDPEYRQLPRLIIIGVDLDSDSVETDATAYLISFDKEVLDAETAEKALAETKGMNGIPLTEDNKSRSIPQHLDGYFAQCDSDLDDLEWARGWGFNGRLGLYGGSGGIRGNFGLYGYGNRGHYGYGYRNHRRNWGRYGFYNNSNRYPYRDSNYRHRGQNRNFYFYYNPAYRWN